MPHKDPEKERARKRRDYANAKDAHKERTTRNRRKVVVENRRVLEGVKALRGCATCGESDPRCLEFHHTGPKNFTVSAGLHLKLEKVLAEVELCVVLCSNCHAKLHYSPID